MPRTLFRIQAANTMSEEAIDASVGELHGRLQDVVESVEEKIKNELEDRIHEQHDRGEISDEEAEQLLENLEIELFVDVW